MLRERLEYGCTISNTQLVRDHLACIKEWSEDGANVSASKDAAIYCRISRDAEGDGEGVERQERLCREIADRLHLNVVEVYTDNDIGASDRTSDTKQRTAYKQMIADARVGNFHHLLAYSNSRLTRRMLELEDLIQLHEQSAVVIHTVASGDDDLSTSDGRMVARIKASVDAAESDRIAERQRAASLHRALQGKPKLQRQRAFGWEDDGLTIRESEAAHIRAAVEKLKQGASVTQIRHEWERAGIKTAAGNAEWPWQTINRVLVGWRTAGVRTYHREPLRDSTGELVMGEWEAIITLKDREDALVMLRQRSIKKVRQGTWYLSGKVRCGMCGGKMYGQLTDTPTYGCKPGNGHNIITADKLETYVQLELNRHITERLRKTRTISTNNEPEQSTDWPQQDELDRTNAQIEELMGAYQAGRLSGEIVFPQVDELDQKRQVLRTERDDHYAKQAEPKKEDDRIERLKWASKNLMAPIFPTDDEETVAHKTLLMQNELDTVIIHKGKRGRAGWGPETFKSRIEIIWRE